MKVAYQGVPGAYSEKAARALFPGCDTLPCETFAAVFEAVESRRAQAAAIPVENSLAGSIHENYDLLVRHALRVCGETYVRVEHALMAPRGTALRDVREVRSHPQALAQCAGWFAANKQARAVTWYDTAGAAASLSEDPEPGVAAIASETAAAIYGLRILKRRLQDRPRNFTRFLAIVRDGSKVAVASGSKARAAFKTSLTFIPARNRAGVLHAVTGVFASRGIDLTKVESRPDPENPFDYRFYLDASGTAKEAPLKAALAELKKLTRELRVLGSYPAAKLPR
jgi:prephenate dehydratase